MNDGHMVTGLPHMVQPDRRRSIAISVSVHLILLLLLLYPIMQSKSKSIEVDSYLIIDYSSQLLSEQDADRSEKSKASTVKKKNASKSRAAPKKNNASKPYKAKQHSIPKEVPQRINHVASVVKKTGIKTSRATGVTDPSTEIVRLQKEKDKQEEKENIEREAELRRVKEKESKEIYQTTKAEFSNLFAETSGGGESNTNDESLTGQILQSSGEAIPSSGSGLSGRKLLYAPQIQDESQATGIIVITLCVDQQGHVLSSRYTQKGSTSSDRHLISSAMKAVKQYKFSKNQTIKECGELFIDFKLK